MRLVLAGIRRPIAQRPLALSLLTAAATLALAAPSLAADPLATTTAAATGTVTTGVSTATTTVDQAVGSVSESVPPPAQPVVKHVADSVPPVAPRPAATEPVRRVTEQVQGTPATQPVERATSTAHEISRSVPGSGGDLPRRARPLDDELAGAVDGALRSLGDSLRGIVPLDSLAAPFAALLADSGLVDFADRAPLAFGRVFAGSDAFGARPDTGGLGSGGPGAGVLDAAAGSTPPVQPATATPPSNLRKPQSASAQPPAAEAGGRPAGSPSPRKAPVPTAGGAVAASSGGLTFVPFLALLVLAALAAPKLMRRLDAGPALLRPSLFACALERPG